MSDVINGCRCYQQRRHAVIRRLVDIRARLDQRAYYRLVAPSSGDLNRRRTFIHRLFDVCARYDQRPHHNIMAVLSGHEQWRHAAIRLVDVYARRISTRTNSSVPP